MASPGIFGTQGSAADSDHLVGALVLVVAVVASAEVVRMGRYVNVAAGAWLGLAPWILAGAQLPAQLTTSVAGIALVGLSLPRGEIRENYGTADRFIR